MFDPWNWPTPPDAWANVGELVAFNSLLYDHYDRNAVFFHSFVCFLLFCSTELLTTYYTIIRSKNQVFYFLKQIN